MYFDTNSPDAARQLADALERLAVAARHSHWDAWAHAGLSATQRLILQSLRAPGEARSVKSLAALLGVSSPTVSDAVSALQQKGLVERVADAADARAKPVRLSRAGRALVDQLAQGADPLLQAAQSLAAADQATMYRLVLQLIRQLQASGHIATSRMCLHCRFFEPHAHAGERPHHCHLVGEPLADRHLRLDCAEQQPADPDAQRVIWARFVQQPPQEI
ncbi:MAG: MarR family transcriptional regulator [Pseudomonadota bacterium]